MSLSRFERYTIRERPEDDDVVIVMSQWKNGLLVGVFSLLMFGVPLAVPVWRDGVAPGDVEYWPWSCVGLLLGGLVVLLGLFIQRWTISRSSVTYSSTFRRTPRTVSRRDLAALAVHYQPPERSPSGEYEGPNFQYYVRFRSKDGDEFALPEIQFVQQRVFDEFLIALHAVLPLPIDDPEGLLAKGDKPGTPILDREAIREAIVYEFGSWIWRVGPTDEV